MIKAMNRQPFLCCVILDCLGWQLSSIYLSYPVCSTHSRAEVTYVNYFNSLVKYMHVPNINYLEKIFLVIGMRIQHCAPLMRTGDKYYFVF